MRFSVQVLYFLLLMAYSQSAFSQQQNAIVDVYGLTCSMCSRNVENALMKIDFVDRVEANLEKANFEIFFGSTTIELDALFEAVKKAGFTLGMITLDPRLLKSDENCLTKDMLENDQIVVKLAKKSNKGEERCMYSYEVVPED